MNECCVCYNEYDKEHFSIICNHNLCGDCFSNIKNKLCPMCRCKMKLNQKKGKINLKKYDKIKYHLQYKYRLQGRRKNKMRDNKNLYIRRCIGVCV